MLKTTGENNLIRILNWFFYATTVLLANPLLAQTIDKIEIQGSKKIEVQAIEEKLSSKVGESVDDKLVRQDILELFKTGFFYDVKVETKMSAGKRLLVYTVVEKPSISEITFVGNDEMDSDDLFEAAELKTYEIIDHSKLQSAVEKLLTLYEEKGFLLAQIEYKLIDSKDSEGVKLEFKIQENAKVIVKNIRFIGNGKITTSKIKSFMRTKEGDYFSFMSSAGAYKQEAFEQDLRLINYLYYNEGYLQVKIARPQVYVSPDKKGIYITIYIDEGEQFKIGDIEFDGDLMFTTSELREATSIKSGEMFVYEDILKDTQSVQAKYGDLGFAFTNVIPRNRVHERDKTVDIIFEIEKGNKVYIGEINVVGNTKTQDKVLRRELRVKEGELYHETRKRRSLENIKRLGYFEDVNFNTKTPPGRPDIMDIDIVVKERTTGTLQVGAGYSSFSGFVFQGQVNQMNLFGLGQKLGLTMDLNKKESLFNFNFTEPYFNDTKWSLGFDLYHSSQERVIEYSQYKTGGAARVGYPLDEFLYGYIRLKVDNTNIKIGEDGDQEIYPVETANGETRSLTFTLQYDERDDRFTPSKGGFASTSIEYAGLGGHKNYTKGNVNLRYYKNIFWDLVWRNNISYSRIESNTSDPVPFNELSLIGGANTLRGYQFFSVGRKKRSQDAYDRAISSGYPSDMAEMLAMRPFGGKQELYYNLEFQFPLVKEQGILGVVFYDIGQAEDTLEFSEFKSDVGFGFRWFSPIGPLRFEWGFPLDRNKELGEDNMQFQFAIGAPF